MLRRAIAYEYKRIEGQYIVEADTIFAYISATISLDIGSQFIFGPNCSIIVRDSLFYASNRSHEGILKQHFLYESPAFLDIYNNKVIINELSCWPWTQVKTLTTEDFMCVDSLLSPDFCEICDGRIARGQKLCFACEKGL